MGGVFLFNADWALEDGFEDQVTRVWKDSIEPLPEKLTNLGKYLKIWANSIGKKRTKKERELTLEQLEKLNQEDPEETTLVSIIKVKLALNMEADKKEIYWVQELEQTGLS